MVDKSLNIRSENCSTNCIVNAGNPDNHVINVSADYVNIGGFTVKGAIGDSKAGILLSKGYCNVLNNTLSDNYFGILLRYSFNTSIINNNVSNNVEGIWLSYSNNTIRNNSANNNEEGIVLWGATTAKLEIIMWVTMADMVFISIYLDIILLIRCLQNHHQNLYSNILILQITNPYNSPKR